MSDAQSKETKALMPKRVMYVLPKRAYFSEGDRGRVSHALGVIDGLSQGGHQVTAISGEGLHDYRGQVHPTATLRQVSSRSVFWDFSLLKAAQKELESSRVDVFIVRYAVSKFLLCWILNRLAKRYGAKTVLEVNSYAFHFKSIPKVLRAICQDAEIWFTSRFDVAYVVSAALGKMLKKMKCQTAIAIVPNGAFLPVSEVDGRSVGEDSVIRLVYLGTLHRYYDFDIVVKGFRALEESGLDCELHFFGSGAMLQQLKADSTGLSGVYFHGRYKREDTPRFLSKTSDVLILPPKHRWDVERSGGLSTKLFEYMSLGVPIVAPRMAEVADILEDGETASMYDPDDLDSFVEACSKACTSSVGRAQLGHKAKQLFIEKYTWAARMNTLMQRIGND